MKLNRTIQNSVLAVTLVATGAFVGAQVNAAKHPHLAAAQQHGREAFRELSEAQQANSFDMEGHAQKAKDLLEQANRELDMAVQAANKNAGRR
jgi:hypothetical protein